MEAGMNPRSYLFVPANRPELFAKACGAGADAVIADLEDAVPPGEKSKARADLAEWLDLQHPVWIRTNGVHTDWFDDDIELCRLPGVAGVVLPKTDGPDHVARVRDRLAHSTLPILPIIETARGMWNAYEIARAGSV